MYFPLLKKMNSAIIYQIHQKKEKCEMKKYLFIPIIILIASAFLIVGCKNKETSNTETADVQVSNPSIKPSESSVSSINSQAFNGFINECRHDKELSDSIDRLRSAGKPVKKEAGVWTYLIKSEVMGMPVKAIILGVCDSNGGRECGGAGYTAVVIGKPLNEVKGYLKEKTGIDFTQENREGEMNSTLRPVLRSGDKNDESILFCDLGDA